MIYKRTLAEIIVKSFQSGFITIIYGARRVGKTVLLEQIKDVIGKKEKFVFFNGDTSETINALGTTSEVVIHNLIKDYEYIFIDEAQRIPNISLVLKIIIDAFPDKKIIVTGSSSLDISRGARENLTGRHNTFNLHPLSTKELGESLPNFKIPSLLEQQLIFGGYPRVHMFSATEDKKKYLINITNDYLLKDVLELERLENPENLKKLATLLAYQIGGEVSLQELSRTLNSSVKTVSRYIDLLEKSFVIFHLDGYSTNMRNEVGKGKKKYYFYDLGIRNALIGQFQSLSERVDVGALWENFIIAEKIRKNEYEMKFSTFHFWRNYAGTEVDLIEKTEKGISAFEIKWSKSKIKTPPSFKDTYNTDVELINKENYLQFIL